MRRGLRAQEREGGCEKGNEHTKCIVVCGRAQMQMGEKVSEQELEVRGQAEMERASKRALKKE